ncbi:hypothetical protein [Sediminicurvatus halobius]|uniref:Uncharacterized protein n=1 Tax=Sediminicurvatus halobius TaxID=2182432 RepID=A0A2U2MXU8_9GAMM|nr:hypothetical protein [Spiribacter halobius]PWG61602.1 hypothetical protein DEM34_15545 [Spiribacter halobius]UEX77279.1 hypothetical protein LMH63_15215 [Spiribacter halobius]
MQILNALLNDSRMLRIWNYPDAPLLCALPPSADSGFRAILLVRFRSDARTGVWLRADELRKPRWRSDARAWQVPVSWFDRLTQRCLEDHGAVYLVHTHVIEQVCTPSCQTATRHWCECSCQGRNHGIARDEARNYAFDGAFIVESFVKHFICRKLTTVDGWVTATDVA